MTGAARITTVGCLIALLLGLAGPPALAQAAGAPPQDTKWPEGLAAFDAELRNLRKQDKIAEIRTLCQERYASATDPEHRAYYLRSVGNSYEWQEDWDQAIPIFQQVIAEFPLSNGQVPWAMLDLAQAHIRKSELGNREQNLALAVPVLEQFVKHYPNHNRFVGGLCLLGMCQEGSGSDETALVYYLQGVERYPAWPYARSCVLLAATLKLKLEQWGDVVDLARSHLYAYPQEQPAGAHLTVALGYVGTGDVTAALTQLDLAAAEYSLHPDESLKNWEHDWAFLRRVAGCPQATPLLEQALAARPKDETAAFIKLALGRVAVRAGDKDEAAQWCQRVIAEHPDSELAPEAHFWAGWCLMTEHPADAIPHFEQVVAEDTAHDRVVKALGYLGACYSDLGDFEAAQAAYTELAAREEAAQVAAGLLAEANALARDKRFDESTAKCLQVIALAPGSEHAQAAQALIGNPLLAQIEAPAMVIAKAEIHAALALSREEKYDESIAACEQIIAEDPQSLAAAEAALLIGHNLFWAQRVSAAMVQYQAVREQHPDTPEGMEARYYEAECKSILVPMDEALAEWERVIARETDPTRRAMTYINISELNRHLGNYDAAREAIDAALADDRPGAIERRGGVLLELARWHKQQGHYDKAREQYEVVVRQYPGTSYAETAQWMLENDPRVAAPGK